MTLTWQVDGMTVDKSLDGLTDVVTFVQWRLIGEDGTYVDPAGETVPNVAAAQNAVAAIVAPAIAIVFAIQAAALNAIRANHLTIKPILSLIHI